MTTMRTSGAWGNVLFLICCVVLGARAWQANSGKTTDRPDQVEVGDVLNLRGVDLSKTPKTLVMYVAPRRILKWDTLRELSQLPRNHKSVRVVMITSDARATKDAIQANHIRVDDLIELDMSTVGIRAHPMLLLLDRSGTLLRLWGGQPSSALPELRLLLSDHNE